MSRLLDTNVVPNGCFKDLNDFQSYIDLANELQEPVIIYHVAQSGYMSEEFIFPNAEIYLANAEFGFHRIRNSKNQYGSDTILCEGCLPGKSYNVHRTFASKILAEQYSKEMKNDVEYMKDVRRHHEACNELDQFIDDYDWRNDEE